MQCTFTRHGPTEINKMFMLQRLQTMEKLCTKNICVWYSFKKMKQQLYIFSFSFPYLHAVQLFFIYDRIVTRLGKDHLISRGAWIFPCDKLFFSLFFHKLFFSKVNCNKFFIFLKK